MAELSSLKNITEKCIYCSNLIIRWNFGGAELNMFCAHSRDMRATECSYFELVKIFTCKSCGQENESTLGYCSACSSPLD